MEAEKSNFAKGTPGRADFEERITKIQGDLILREKELNARLDAEIASKSHRHPKAIYYIIPSELAERFSSYGISRILLNYWRYFGGLEKELAKAQVHVFVMMLYFFPIVGAALSDSYLAKYETITILSIVNFIGSALLAVTSINGWLGTLSDAAGNPNAAPFWTIFIPLLLIAFGGGGMKPCVSSHGGDQYLSMQSLLLTRFYALFYASINIGAITGGYLAPALMQVGCFGANACYPLAFMVPSVFFLVALVVFVVGKKHYRIVPPAGTFLPWVGLKAVAKASFRFLKASPAERKSTDGWLNFVSADYGAAFVYELRLLGTVIFMIIPYIFFFVIYDQGLTEWQLQYEHMDPYYIFNWKITGELSTNINSVLLITFLLLMSTFVYPFLEKRGLMPRPLKRMQIGFFVVLLAFGLSAVLQWHVDRAFEDALAAGGVVLNGEEVVQCVGCVNGIWQIPQWAILTFGECFSTPVAFEFVYSEVGPRFRATASGLWLMTISFGNMIIAGLEAAMHGSGLTTPQRQGIWCAIGAFGLLASVLQSRFWFVYKADRTDLGALTIQRAALKNSDDSRGHAHASVVVHDTAGARELTREKTRERQMLPEKN